MSDESASEETFQFQTVGEQLRTEREKQSLTLADLAARTRVPMRHLEAIEKSDFSALPGTTYTLGFTRSYARALGLDDAELSKLQRSELAQGGFDGYPAPSQTYEPADPARVPPRALAWAAAAIAVLLVAGYLFWRSYFLGGDVADPYATPAPAVQTKPNAATPATAPTTADSNGAVVLTATDIVWIKVYDADEKRLFEKEMQPGETFAVPQDAKNPMIVTGRPQVLTVTVNGKAVPPLGEPDRTIADVGISAAALLARQSAPATNAASESERAVSTSPAAPATQ